MTHVSIEFEHSAVARVASSDLGRVWRLALVGCVGVGKSTLFERLCADGGRAVEILQSPFTVTRGLLTLGPAGAPAAMRRRCAACAGNRAAAHTALGRSPCMSPDHSRACPELASIGRKETELRPPCPQAVHLFDAPGVTTLAASSEDEMIVRDLTLSGQLDGLVLVADPKNLRRSLALVLEFAEFGLPMALDLNLLDEAEDLGLRIDDWNLSSALGMPVARTVAVEGRGVARLAELALDAKVPTLRTRLPEGVEDGLAELVALLPNAAIAPRGLGLLLLRDDRAAERWVSRHFGPRVLEAARAVAERVRGAFATPVEVLLSETYHAEAQRIAARVVTNTTRPSTVWARVGSLAQRPWPGSLIALMVLGVAYLWVGVFGASFLVDRVTTPFLDGWLLGECTRLGRGIPSALVRDALFHPSLGVLPSGLFLALGVVLPVLFCFYLAQAALEDSGYLARLAVLSERVMSKLGLNGKALIPLVLGLSCATMSIIGARSLPTRKERTILTLLVVGIPCAPLLAAMAVILADLPWTATAGVFGLIAVRLLVAGHLSSRVLPGTRSDFILELPPMRLPRLAVLLQKTWRRSWQFLKEALPVFVLASLVVFLLDRLGGLLLLERLAQPVVRDLLGLPDGAVRVFIKAAIRRENGAAELAMLRGAFTELGLVVTLVVMTFLVPCVNATVVIFKERGWRTGLGILGVVTLSGLLAGGLLNVCGKVVEVVFG